MSNRKEEERNEKIIRGLLKLPPNRRCINCNSVGPQYVCTNFLTFVCIACSGIHREFTHRVKSVSMAKFTSQEVEALQKGGNQRARDIYLKNWDLQKQRLPDSSNPDRIRDFIKGVYVEKKYIGGKAADKPPRDMQSQKSLEDDIRRASSYHSYSQSPPYDNQYEERRYGKQAGVLARRPGSDRGHYFEGRLSSLIYSPGCSEEQMFEDRFSNEGFNSRASDYSISSGGDPSRSGAQSPNSQKEYGFSSPPISNTRNSASEDARRPGISGFSDGMMKKDMGGIPRPQRTTSSGSFGSFDSNSVSHKSNNSACLADLILEPEQSESLHSSASVNVMHWDPFGPSVQAAASCSYSEVNLIPSAQHEPVSVAGPSKASTPSTVDLFAGIAHHQLSSPMPPFANPYDEVSQQPSIHEQVSAAPSTVTEGWATFDLPQRATSSSDTKQEAANIAVPSNSSLHATKPQILPHLNDALFPSIQSSMSQGALPISAIHATKPQTLLQRVHDGILPAISVNNEKQEYPRTRTFENGLKAGEVDDMALNNLPQSAVVSSFPSTVINQWKEESFSIKPSFDSEDSLKVGNVENFSSNILQQTAVDGSFPSTAGSQLKGESHFVNPSFGSTDSQGFGFNESEASSISYLYSSVPSLDFGSISNRPSSLSLAEPTLAHEHKSRNPFELPNDIEPEPTSWFFDMNSLQAALPDPSLPSSYGADLTNPWFPQSSQASYIPSIPPGGLNYIPGQTPAQLPNHSAHGSVASLGGNPFA